MSVLSKMIFNTAISKNAIGLACLMVFTYWTSKKIIKARTRKFAKENNIDLSKKDKKVSNHSTNLNFVINFNNFDFYFCQKN